MFKCISVIVILFFWNLINSITISHLMRENGKLWKIFFEVLNELIEIKANVRKLSDRLKRENSNLR